MRFSLDVLIFWNLLIVGDHLDDRLMELLSLIVAIWITVANVWFKQVGMNLKIEFKNYIYFISILEDFMDFKN
jgi:hypothetical protein